MLVLACFEVSSEFVRRHAHLPEIGGEISPWRKDQGRHVTHLPGWPESIPNEMAGLEWPRKIDFRWPAGTNRAQHFAATHGIGFDAVTREDHRRRECR